MLVWPPVHNYSLFSGNRPQNTGVVAQKQVVKNTYYPVPWTLTDPQVKTGPQWASCEESSSETLQLLYPRETDPQELLRSEVP